MAFEMGRRRKGKSISEAYLFLGFCRVRTDLWFFNTRQGWPRGLWTLPYQPVKWFYLLPAWERQVSRMDNDNLLHIFLQGTMRIIRAFFEASTIGGFITKSGSFKLQVDSGLRGGRGIKTTLNSVSTDRAGCNVAQFNSGCAEIYGILK